MYLLITHQDMTPINLHDLGLCSAVKLLDQLILNPEEITRSGEYKYLDNCENELFS